MSHAQSSDDALPALMTPLAALLRGFEFEPEPLVPAVQAQGRIRTAPARQIATDAIRQGFRIGPLNLMVGYADGSELTEMPTAYRLPHAPDWLLGMANLHGMLVPVFDLARHFGLNSAAPAKPMLLVLAHGRDAAGIVIDGLPERLRWRAEQETDSAIVPEALIDVVDRAVLIDDKLWFDLDCNTLLDRLETALTARH
jgi:twitching motility protein PilI